MANIEELMENLNRLSAMGQTDTASLEKAFKDHIHPKMRKRKVASNTTSNIQNILPTKGFAVKTSDAAGKKVFINVCGHLDVPLPSAWKENEEPSEFQASLIPELLRLPVSIGPLREDSDHTGASCHTIDLVFNQGLLMASEKRRELKVHMIRTAFDCTQRHFNLKLDPKWKLPKLRYKGQIVQQDMNLSNLPPVEEVIQPHVPNVVRHSEAETNGIGPKYKAQISELSNLEYEIGTEGHPVEEMKLTVRGIQSFEASDISIELSGFQLIIKTSFSHPCFIELPFSADPANSFAEIDSKGILSLNLKYSPLEKWWTA